MMDQKDQFDFEFHWTEIEPKIAGFFMRKGLSAEDVEDMTQEVAVRAWQNLSTLREKEKFQSWAFSIGTNIWRDYCKKRKHSTVQIIEENIIADHRENPEKVVSDIETVKKILEDMKEFDEIVWKILDGIYKEEDIRIIIEKIMSEMRISQATAYRYIGSALSDTYEKYFKPVETS